MKTKAMLLALLLMFLPITQSFANINNYLGAQKNLFNYGWAEASAFSLMAYSDYWTRKEFLPPGWSYLTPASASIQTNGYFGASFYRCENGKQGKCTIVISHRGTDSIWSMDTWNDFLIAMGKVPAYYMQALSYANYVIQFVEDNFPGYPGGYSWTITGHSLGAILAELNTYPFPPYYHDGFNATVFDSPGSKEIIQSAIADGTFPNDALDFITQRAQYDFSGANAINTCNTQLKPPAINPEFSYEDFLRVLAEPLAQYLYVNPPSDTYYIAGYSVNQHRMINFYNRWHSAAALNTMAIRDNFIWPVGHWSGYKNYLTYNLRPDYWDRLIDYIWQNSPTIQAYYYQGELYYKKAFINNLGVELKQLETKLSNEIAHSMPVLKNNVTSPQKFIIPEKWLKKMTLEDVLNNNLDGYSAERKKIYAEASDDKKLYYAVICDDAVVAQKLLQETHANPNTQHGERHYSLLQIAIISGDLDVVKVLLKYGANPELTDIKGDTALHTAARERYEDAYLYAEELVKANAKKDAKNKEGKTALMLAEEQCTRCSAQIAEDAKKNMVLAGQKTWCQTMCNGEFAKTLEK